MSRNEETATDTIDFAEYAVSKNLSEDQIEKLESMTAEERQEHLAILVQAELDGDALNFVDVETDELDNMKVFTVGDLVPGQILSGRYLGVRHIFSKKLKENWKEFVAADGTVYYYNAIYVFEGITDKKEWGIFKSPTLNLLEKMTTLASGSGKKNPAVKLTYIGKIEGRDVLERDYKLKITKGTSAHVFKVQHEPNTEILKFEVKGIVCSLNSPLPMTSSTAGGAKVDKLQSSANNFNRLKQAGMGKGAVLIGESTNVAQ